MLDPTDDLEQKIYQVSVFNTHRDYFNYYGVSNQSFHIGARVWVPFRNKTRLGIIIGEEKTSSLDLKSIIECLDTESFIPLDIIALCRWLSQYYHAPLPLVFTSALPKRFRLGKALSLRSSKIRSIPKFENDSHALPKELNAEQAYAVQSIQAHEHQYHCFLLNGVTGSGKTEIYLQLAAYFLAKNKQILILVPEIGLTPQLLSRFSERFQVSIAAVHSQLTDNERAKIWQQAKEKKIQLIIGTRAALFTPLPELQLIMIDEEHDPSFKQIEGVRFSARDAAIIRAQLSQIPIVLGSATPSLESLHNCEIGKYTQLQLTQKAQNNFPTFFQLVDLRKKRLEEGLAHETLKCIQNFLDKQQQILIFINRRGFSPVLLCSQCGWIAGCEACDSHLTLHQKNEQLICHHCNAKRKPPSTCPQCNSHQLSPIGYGTQRIEQALHQHFPSIHVIRMDRDEVKTTETLNTQLTQINNGAAQIIIGTQMLAKGHHFPNLGLVIILEADTGFYNQDFRALERLGQLITQVSGRAGRAQQAGHVLIQTYLPQHPLLNLLIQNGYQAFANALLPLRQVTDWPPYYSLAIMRVQGKLFQALHDFLVETKQILTQNSTHCLGPAPAPLARKSGHYQMQLLIKAPSKKKLQSALKVLIEHLQQNPKKHTIRWTIDVDPVDLT